MNGPIRSERSVAVSVWAYRILLVLYPSDFRRRHGIGMAQVFRDLARDAWRGQGFGGLAALWGRTAIDLILTAVPERASQFVRRVQMSPKSSALLVVAIVLTLGTGYLNTHTDELMVVVPWVVVVTVALGSVQPRRPWLWAFLIGLAVPLSQVFAGALGLRVPYPNAPNDMLTSCVAIVPAFVGAYVGAGIRRLGV
jgi:hypothetical protein